MAKRNEEFMKDGGEPILTVKKLQVSYDKVNVFSNLSFEVREGDFICIVGQNGAGKSTLIKTLLGSIKQSKGEIIFHNLKRKFIGYMPQESKVDKNFPASVSEIVYSGTLNRIGVRPFYGREEEKVVSECLILQNVTSQIFRVDRDRKSYSPELWQQRQNC